MPVRLERNQSQGTYSAPTAFKSLISVLELEFPPVATRQGPDSRWRPVTGIEKVQSFPLAASTTPADQCDVFARLPLHRREFGQASHVAKMDDRPFVQACGGARCATPRFRHWS